MTKLNLKTALTAVTLAAATFAAPLSAQASDYNRKCNDTTNSVAGGLIGGSVGAAVGEQIAGRRDRTEGAVIGAIIGGLAGAAIGDGASDCERDNVRSYDNRGRNYNTSNNRYVTTTRYPSRNVVSNTGFQTVGFNRGFSNVSYGHTDRISLNRRLHRIDRQIEDLRRECAYLLSQRKRSRRGRHGIDRRLDQISYSLKQLERERKQLKKAKYRRTAHW